MKISLKDILLESGNGTRFSPRNVSLTKYIHDIQKTLTTAIGEHATAHQNSATDIEIDDGEGGFAFYIKVYCIGKNRFNVEATVGGKRVWLADKTCSDVCKWISTDLKDEYKKLDKLDAKIPEKVSAYMGNTPSEEEMVEVKKLERQLDKKMQELKERDSAGDVEGGTKEAKAVHTDRKFFTNGKK